MAAIFKARRFIFVLVDFHTNSRSCASLKNTKTAMPLKKKFFFFFTSDGVGGGGGMKVWVIAKLSMSESKRELLYNTF